MSSSNLPIHSDVVLQDPGSGVNYPADTNLDLFTVGFYDQTVSIPRFLCFFYRLLMVAPLSIG